MAARVPRSASFDDVLDGVAPRSPPVAEATADGLLCFEALTLPPALQPLSLKHAAAFGAGGMPLPPHQGVEATAFLAPLPLLPHRSAVPSAPSPLTLPAASRGFAGGSGRKGSWPGSPSSLSESTLSSLPLHSLDDRLAEHAFVPRPPSPSPAHAPAPRASPCFDRVSQRPVLGRNTPPHLRCPDDDGHAVEPAAPAPATAAVAAAAAAAAAATSRMVTRRAVRSEARPPKRALADEPAQRGTRGTQSEGRAKPTAVAAAAAPPPSAVAPKEHVVRCTIKPVASPPRLPTDTAAVAPPPAARAPVAVSWSAPNGMPPKLGFPPPQEALPPIAPPKRPRVAVASVQEVLMRQERECGGGGDGKGDAALLRTPDAIDEHEVSVQEGLRARRAPLPCACGVAIANKTSACIACANVACDALSHAACVGAAAAHGDAPHRDAVWYCAVCRVASTVVPSRVEAVLAVVRLPSDFTTSPALQPATAPRGGGREVALAPAAVGAAGAAPQVWTPAASCDRGGGGATDSVRTLPPSARASRTGAAKTGVLKLRLPRDGCTARTAPTFMMDAAPQPLDHADLVVLCVGARATTDPAADPLSIDYTWPSRALAVSTNDGGEWSTGLVTVQGGATAWPQRLTVAWAPSELHGDSSAAVAGAWLVAVATRKLSASQWARHLRATARLGTSALPQAPPPPRTLFTRAASSACGCARAVDLELFLQREAHAYGALCAALTERAQGSPKRVAEFMATVGHQPWACTRCGRRTPPTALVVLEANPAKTLAAALDRGVWAHDARPAPTVVPGSVVVTTSLMLPCSK